MVVGRWKAKVFMMEVSIRLPFPMLLGRVWSEDGKEVLKMDCEVDRGTS